MGLVLIDWANKCISRIVGLTGNGPECAGRFGLETTLSDTSAGAYPGIGDRSRGDDGMFITLEILGPTPTPTASPTPTPTALSDGLSINDVSILEGDSGLRSAVFSVVLRGRRRDPVSVVATTANGSAVAGSDYDAQSATLVFSSTESQKTFSVPVRGDRTFEPNETFTVTLSSAVGAPLGDAIGIGTILNDEGLSVGVPELSPADPVTAPEDVTALTLRWTHPERWRELNTVDLRLIDGERAVFWARFDEAANTIAVCDAAGVCGAGLPPGTGEPVGGDAATFYPADSAVQGSGPTGPSVDLVFAFSLARSLAGHVLRIETAATEDSGATQNFLPLGSLQVTGNSTTGGADSDSCAITVGHRRATPGDGALVLGLVMLVLLRRRR